MKQTKIEKSFFTNDLFKMDNAREDYISNLAETHAQSEHSFEHPVHKTLKIPAMSLQNHVNCIRGKMKGGIDYEKVCVEFSRPKRRGD